MTDFAKMMDAFDTGEPIPVDDFATPTDMEQWIQQERQERLPGEVREEYELAKERAFQQHQAQAKQKIQQQKAAGLATAIEDVRKAVTNPWVNPVNAAIGSTDLGASVQRAVLAGSMQFVTGTQALLARVGIPTGEPLLVENTADKLNREEARFSAATESANIDAGLSENSRWVAQRMQGISRSLSEVLFYAPLTGGLGSGLKVAGKEVLKKGTKWAAAPLIASFAIKAANSALTEARDAGLSEGEARRYALIVGGIEAIVTGIFQAKGIPGLESFPKMFLQSAEKSAVKTAIRSLGHEASEELLIGFSHALTQKLSGVDLEAFSISRLRQMTVDTLAETVGAMGAIQSPMLAQAAIKKFSKEDLSDFDKIVELVKQDPEAARKMADNPTRKAVQDATGIKKQDMTRLEREQLAEDVNRAAAEVATEEKPAHFGETPITVLGPAEREGHTLVRHENGKEGTLPTSEIKLDDDATRTAEAGQEEVVRRTPEQNTEEAQNLLDRMQETYGVQGELTEAPETELVGDIASLADSLGINLQYFNVSGEQPLSGAGLSETRTVVLNAADIANNETKAAWPLVYHEFSHATGIDLLSSLDPALVDVFAKKYLLGASENLQAAIEANPELRQREGGAKLIEEFATNPKFHKAVLESDPSLYRKLVDFLVELFQDWAPKSKAIKDVIEAFRAEIEKHASSSAGNVNKTIPTLSTTPLKKYSFEGMNAIGEEISDTIEAASKKEATEKIQQQGIFVTDIKQVSSLPSDEEFKESDGIPKKLQFSKPEVEGSVEESRGIKEATLKDVARETLGWFLDIGTRAHENIPNTPELAMFRETLRLTKAIEGNIVDTAAELVHSVSKDLSLSEAEVFRKLVLLRDWQQGLEGKSADEIERIQHQIGKTPKEALTWVNEELETFEAMNTEAILEAFGKRETYVKAIGEEAVRRNLLPKEILEDDRFKRYFHHQVLVYHNGMSRFGTPKGMKQSKLGVARPRARGGKVVDPTLVYNTDFSQPETAYLTQVLTAIEVDKLIDNLRAYSKPVMDEYKQSAREAKEADPETKVTWRTFLKQDDKHLDWVPLPGRFGFQVMTLSEKLVEELQKEQVDSVEVGLDDLQKNIAFAKTPDPLILPAEMVLELNKLEDRKAPPWGSKLSKTAMGWWKSYILHSPLGIVPYSIRNIFGDLGPVVSAAPGIIPYVTKDSGKLVRQLWNFYLKKDPNALGAMRKHLGANGVLTATRAANEIPGKATHLEPFSSLPIQKWPASVWLKYWDWIHRFSDFRESILRVAADQYYFDKLTTFNAGKLKKPMHWGASKKESILEIQDKLGTQVAASHMARTLMGDYANRTVAGEWLRDHLIPFYSFKEIAVQRNVQIARNNIAMIWEEVEADVNASETNKKLSKAKRTALIATRAGAIRAAVLVGRHHWLIVIAWLNNLMFCDNDMTADEKRSIHLCLPIWFEDGSQVIFRRPSDLGEVYEMVGLASVASLFPEFKEGRVTGMDILTETGRGMATEIYASLHPIKGLGEIATGKSLYPDAFNPRTVSRTEAFSSALGERDVGAEIFGRLSGSGERSRPHFALRTLIGITDPRRSKLHKMYDLREKYAKKIGKRIDPNVNQSPGRHMKAAAENDDRKAFAQARKKYISDPEKKRGYKNFVAYLKAMDPIDKTFTDEEIVDFESNFLTAAERKDVKDARDYAAVLQIKLFHWWNDAAGDDAETKKIVQATIANRASDLARIRPSKGSREWQKRRTAWEKDQTGARKWLTAHGYTPDEILSVYWDDVKQEHSEGVRKDWSTSRAGYGRLKRSLDTP